MAPCSAFASSGARTGAGSPTTSSRSRSPSSSSPSSRRSTRRPAVARAVRARRRRRPPAHSRLPARGAGRRGARDRGDARPRPAGDAGRRRPFLVVVLFLPWCLGTYNPRSRAIAGLVFMEAIGLWANIQFAETPGRLRLGRRVHRGRVDDRVHRQPPDGAGAGAGEPRAATRGGAAQRRPTGRSPRSGSGSRASSTT